MNFKDLARVLRLSNLFIIIITQLLCWFCLIKPLAGFLEQNFFLNFNNALLLAIGTALIAGAGYIINDYFDVKIDAINRPDKSLIGKDINPRAAILFHNFCNIAGLGIMAYLSYKLQNPKALIIPIICTVLLWFYSTHFKRQFMIGNIVVSLLTALSLLILIAFEPLPQTFLANPFPINKMGMVTLNPIWILLTYSGFAFLLNWIREIVKDMEDFKGDAEDGCVTMPIKLGLQKTVFFVRILLAITTVLLLLIAFLLIQKEWWAPSLYMIGTLAIPLGFIFFKIGKKSTSAHYAYHSKLLKIVMILGIATLVFFYLYQY